MAEPRPSPSLSNCYNEAFQDHLKKIERRNWEKKIFYLPSEVQSWMNAIATNRTHTNLVGLLAGLYVDVIPDITSKECAGALLVLATLLHPRVNCGNLIGYFTKYRFHDNMLPHSDTDTLYKQIRKDLEDEQPSLPDNYEKHDYKAVIYAFDAMRWAFCPISLCLYMKTDIASPCILPFFYGEVINTKGGTANVHHYKIQEAIVEEVELSEALAPSKQYDAVYGWFYEIAIKSYSPGWEDTYKLESDAFRAIRTNKGVVKYLGEYHFREDVEASAHHNIILEFGQRDLDEYFADNYPPNMTTEIIATWESLFKLADTLKSLHRLKYIGEDGRLQPFKGWHGDFKPDNILRVRDEWKLADFGFTKFEKDEIGKSSTIMLGGTTTYGAPEFASIGATTPLLQTIDTWSFGCVLSVAATWIILGSHEYDIYRKVRMLEIEELRQNVLNKPRRIAAPLENDAFHDGVKVLPSVISWHNHLRNSCRKSDTVSHRVLDLVERKMLLSNPSDRLSSDQLCKELEDILVLARNDHMKLNSENMLNQIDPSLLEALLKLDKNAPATPSPSLNVNSTDEGRSVITSNQTHMSLLPNGNSQARQKSERVKKSERIQQILLAKTAYREQTIEKSLGLNSSVAGTAEIREASRQDSVIDERHLSSIAKGKRAELPSIEIIAESPVPLFNSSFPSIITENGLFGSKALENSFIPREGPDPGTSTEVFSQVPRDLLPRSKLWTEEMPDSKRARKFIQQEGPSTSNPENWALRQPKFDEASFTTSERMQERTLDPISKCLSPTTSQIPSDLYAVRPPAAERRVSSRPSTSEPRTSVAESRPSREISNIAKLHADLTSVWRSKSGTFTAWLPRKGPKEDNLLRKFIHERDIVFVVDNASSMSCYWYEAKMVLETLAMKVGRLDKDGLDLLYTIGQEHNVKNAKGWDILGKFGTSMDRASPSTNYPCNTNMRETLEKIFDTYDCKKRMTLIILTDGLWKGDVSHADVQSLIRNFVQQQSEKLQRWESRWFSIQFVSFGNDKAALKRPRELDDDMDIRDDVVDAKPWDYDDPNMLILGSITGEGDKADSWTPLQSPSSSFLRPMHLDSQQIFQGTERTTTSRSSLSKRNRFSSLVLGKK